MTARYLIGDVFDGLRSLDANSVDLIISSPPFLALRSYLPAGDPNKGKEIGSEQTPADYLDVLLDVVQECRRVLAPHGSLVFELGDTYAGSGGGGGDYLPGGLRENQPGFEGSASASRLRHREDCDLDLDCSCGALVREANAAHWRLKNAQRDSWPLSKSLCGIPTLFAWSLAYGRNLLRPERTVDPWRIRNLIAWVRPNPPVGALGDKFRPATSYLTVACTGARRWFDLDAVREEYKPVARQPAEKAMGKRIGGNVADYPDQVRSGWTNNGGTVREDRGGAPPLDWWEIPTEPYKGSHYATWPRKLLDRPILAMCPRRVCTTCGQPSERLTEPGAEYAEHLGSSWADRDGGRGKASSTDRNNHSGQPVGAHIVAADRTTLGWSDCGHGTWRPGVVCDPFCGSGTTLAVAVAHGRQAIGIDIDPRNADLAYDRVGMWLTVETIGRHGPRATIDTMPL